MKRMLVVLFLLAMVVSLLAVTGCGGDETTFKTPEGDIEATEDNGEFSIEGDEGSVTYEGSDKPPTEQQLGAPVYPDADYVPGSGGTATATGPEGEASTTTGEFRTTDSFDDVVSFYQDELGRPLYIDTSMEEASWMADMGDGSLTAVNVTVDGNEVVIIIVRTNIGEGM